MGYNMFVALQDDDKLSVYDMDAATGALTPKAEVAMPGGPSLLAISPDRNVLYVGHRNEPEISSHQIDHSAGTLAKTGSVIPASAPAYLSTDRRGKFLLSAHYQSGHAAVHPIGDDGAVGAPPTEWLATDMGAHCIQTDRSNGFAFVPHIARLSDNVLEPVKDAPGPNVIFQFRFDEDTGHLTANAPLRVEQGGFLGPRHYCFHPTMDIAYFSDEQGCSVTSYALDPSEGTLTAIQTVPTLPGGFAGRNTCSMIQISSSGRFLYVPNRGHNSIAGFIVDSSSGRLTSNGQTLTEAVPSSFSLDPEGNFLFAAGTASNRLASYRVNGDTGQLTPLETYDVGNRPSWVLINETG